MYQKGYSEDSEENPVRWDYHLSYPRKVQKCGRAEGDFSQYNAYNESVANRVSDHAKRREEIFKQKDITPKSPPSKAKAKDKIKYNYRDTKLSDFLGYRGSDSGDTRKKT
ncbi:MAG: hypothetical protein ACFFG0_37835 [Candidatus Thorarchaeota archaeon]